MTKPYKVLIIEDDFRVAQIQEQMVNDHPNFHVISTCRTGAEALDYLSEKAAALDLILLDVYIPDVKGLELLWAIREKFRGVDIMMVTAAKEVATVQEALRGGIIDYLLKPVQKEVLHQRLDAYVQKRELFGERRQVSQEELDQLRQVQVQVQVGETPLPKGIDRLTLEKVVKALEEAETQGLTAMEGARLIGASRSTVRRYFEYLIHTKKAKAEVNYGDVGRPERRYFLC
ncbi:response regulator [Halalkalibacterium halodurans]|jgi:CitB family two-component system response regulator CitT|uniref:Transcriptional regulator n=1 Tax=Halalkalibacterium halodurans TaxID=86665 RepID=A0A0M0KFG2_ALKHA|nr:response regulator [Halalkalibacterium halodurans]MED3647991.1 response regulator [Halalkalibacterium halodurans]TPE69534.1 response regulator [Halalkalibacterium halodurans]